MHENDIGDLVLESAIRIHKAFGPGLLESVYERVLCMDLEKRGLEVQSQVAIPIVYEGMALGIGFRADIIVASKVLLEIKSIACVKDVHRKQVLTYLRLSHLRLGYVLNFGEELLKNCIIRIVNQLP